MTDTPPPRAGGSNDDRAAEDPISPASGREAAAAPSDRGGEVGDAVPLGRVLGTQPATPLDFWVTLEDGRWVQLDDVVVTERDLPGAGAVTVAGHGHAGARDPRGSNLRL
jgi:hypothetical protein